MKPRRFTPRVMHGRDIGAKRVYRCATCGNQLDTTDKKSGQWHCPRGGFGCDLIHFASKGELARWCQLELLEKVGEIRHLKRQVTFSLNVLDAKPVGKYVADFVYRRGKDIIIEDHHPVDTALSKWKRKHFEIEYGTKILITK